MSRIIVGLGEILWDVFPDRSILGGAPANFAYIAGQFGYEAYAVSAIGKDKLGEDIETVLKDKGLKNVISKVDYPTGTVEVKLDGKGVPNFTIHENVAWDNMPFSDAMAQLASKTNTACFGTLAQRNEVSKISVRKFLAAMPKDSLKMFDINLRQNFYSKELIEESLQLATAMKINDDEVKAISTLFDFEDDNEQNICNYLLKEYNLELVILTKGTDGSFVFTNRETSYQPTQKVQVADTVGAGDSFTAAFVASYMNGDRITDAHKLAVEVSAYVCTQHGAMSPLPDSYRKMFQ